MGYNSVEELVKLQHDYELEVNDIVDTLKRLKKYELIKITRDKVLLNGVYDL